MNNNSEILNSLIKNINLATQSKKIIFVYKQNNTVLARPPALVCLPTDNEIQIRTDDSNLKPFTIS